ncbi:hypothetical protein [Thalassospira marina]|uniref:Phage tail collar domain-containing protein n=1 Tax=Thalassospira marina TaxID=2048283 RepID=A0A2N3KJM7_9PROT|nr:hypothetical protein [Thalassospira marina]PKR50755.1 hypothetical protein COO20_20165 [Thalassospira marina]
MKYIPPFNGDLSNPERSWVNADPANGIEGSIPGATAFEHPIREIVKVITDAGIEPDGGNLTQLSAAISAMIAGAIGAIPPADTLPVGAVLPALGTTPFPGFLMLDASMPLRADYPGLWAYIQTSGNLITEANWNEATSGSFSSGNGATNFRLADARGVSLRGFDGGRGFDAGRVFGTYQADEIKAHTHITSIEASVGGSSGRPSSGGPFGSISAETASTGGPENRVKNITVNWCIKY